MIVETDIMDLAWMKQQGRTTPNFHSVAHRADFDAITVWKVPEKHRTWEKHRPQDRAVHAYPKCM